ncbi:MAG: DUF4423 domain-containing protein, partial [Pseudomonadota bacterium]
LKRLSENIPLQYTYLSKVLNSENTHLSEDHLFKACRLLNFESSETDFTLLLRQRDATQDPDRKDYLKAQIEKRRRDRKLNTDSLRGRALSQNQAEYLLNPMCILVHMALHIDSVKKDPIQLCSTLGISREKLKSLLQIIARNSLIQISPYDPFEVELIASKRFHVGTDHPMMRVHQNLLKMKMATKSFEVEEDEKNSFLVTFTGDDRAFEEINLAFKEFIKKTEQIVKTSRHTKLYQMSFDFFRWL